MFKQTLFLLPLLLLVMSCGRQAIKAKQKAVETAPVTPAATATPTPTATVSSQEGKGFVQKTNEEIVQAAVTGLVDLFRSWFDEKVSLPFYVEQSLQGGKWLMLYNSVGSNNTTSFWNISYTSRLSRKGIPGIATNFYDGSLYLYGTQYMDVIEDMNGKVAVAAVVNALSFDTNTMRFISPTLTLGNQSIFNSHFASGWSSQDLDGDAHDTVNCAKMYGNVSQHYGACWNYNLGVDADADSSGSYLDGAWGPHVYSQTLQALGLSTDGTTYSRVRRITRYVRK